MFAQFLEAATPLCGLNTQSVMSSSKHILPGHAHKQTQMWITSILFLWLRMGWPVPVKYFRCFHTNSFGGNKQLTLLMPFSLTLFSYSCFLPPSQSPEILTLDSSVMTSAPSVSCSLKMELTCPSSHSLLLLFWVPKAKEQILDVYEASCY